ncbi:MAG: D-alanyl-D-alanine carboxypeptidase family protein [Eubacterium sp.]|nr:D-alanyl-D-alanine carboxypeptidase family protein [Eubacterium sp.]
MSIVTLNLNMAAVKEDEKEPYWEIKTEQNNDNAIVVSWDKIKKAEFYFVFRTDRPGGKLISIGRTEGLDFTDENIKKNKVYYYSVTACYIKNGPKVIRKSLLVSGALNALEKPALLPVIPSSSGNIIAWEEVESAYDYKIYKSGSSGGKYKNTGTTRELNFIDNTADSSETVYYSVRARLSEPQYMSGGSNIEKIQSHKSDNQWAYLLINADNPLSKKYSVKPKKVWGNFEMDDRCAGYARSMLAAGTSAGCRFSVVSAYRSLEKQQKTINAQIDFYVGKGYTRKQAEEKTFAEIQLPGASEHNAGLAIDIVTTDWYDNHDDLTVDFANTKEAKWLAANAHKYGFILRYPKGKNKITGISFEPWHFRFIGIYQAKRIKASGLCLEEYMNNIL